MQFYRSLFTLVSLLLLTCFSTLSAQQVAFKRVAPLEELSTGGFMAEISQDQQGYMWFSRQTGLFRYNGYEVVNYKDALDKPETLAKPFFTTKPSGEGTGLGLSLSYKINTNGHGGQLQT